MAFRVTMEILGTVASCSVDDLGAVADDAVILLIHAGQEPRTVHEGDQRDAVGVADPDEA